jgi:hypothetical protein
MWGRCSPQLLPTGIFVMSKHFLSEEPVTFDRLDFHSGRLVPLEGLGHPHCLIRAGFDYFYYCHPEWPLERIEKEGHVIVLKSRFFRPDVMAVI